MQDFLFFWKKHARFLCRNDLGRYPATVLGRSRKFNEPGRCAVLCRKLGPMWSLPQPSICLAHGRGTATPPARRTEQRADAPASRPRRPNIHSALAPRDRHRNLFVLGPDKLAASRKGRETPPTRSGGKGAPPAMLSSILPDQASERPRLNCTTL